MPSPCQDPDDTLVVSFPESLGKATPSKTPPMHAKHGNRTSDYFRKKEDCVGRLERLWGGSGWCPKRVLKHHRNEVIKFQALQALESVFELASEKGIEIKGLWDENGHLPKAMEELGSPRLTVEVCQKVEEYLNEGYSKDERGGSQGECLTVQHFQPIDWRDMDDYEDRNTSGVGEHTNLDIDDINDDVEHTVSGIGGVGDAGGDTDPDVSDINDAVETLPAGLGSARRGSRPRKRKAASSAVDLTRRTESPEQRRASRLEKQMTRLRALRISLDLQSEASLGDETINLLFQFCFGLFPTQNRHLFDPLWLQVDDPLLSTKPQVFPKDDEVHYIPLHHRNPEHWTLVVLKTTGPYVRCEFYDSLAKDSSRPKKVESLLDRWLQKCRPGLCLRFELKNCAQQADGVSCGIFALVCFRRLLEGQDVSKGFDPTKARQDLLDEILQADVSSLSLRESTSLLLLELQAANKEEDQSEGHIQLSTPDNKGGSPYQNGRLIDRHLLEKLVTPGTLEHLRDRHREETKAVEAAQPHVEAAKSAHAMAVQRAAWMRKEFEDVSNTISEEMEGGGAGGTPPPASESESISKLEGPQTTECTPTSDADLSTVSSSLMKIVKDCIRAARATQRDKIKRIMATQVAAADERAKEAEDEVAKLSEEANRREHEVAMLQDAINLGRGLLAFEDQASRVLLGRLCSTAQ